MRPENRSDALTCKLEYLSQERAFGIVARIRKSIDSALYKFLRLPRLENFMTYESTRRMLGDRRIARLNILNSSERSELATIEIEALETARKIERLQDKLHLRYGNRNLLI